MDKQQKTNKVTKKMVENMSQQLHEKNIERMKKNLGRNNHTYVYEKINDHMLRNHKFDIYTLEKNINNLSLKTLLYTQTLTAEFCIKYILDQKYASCVEDTYIDIGDVLNAQPHITKQDLLQAIHKLQ
jgi:hypothetical protein